MSWLPPWNDAERDAHIASLRLAWFCLIRTLDERGGLDVAAVVEDMKESTFLFHDRPQEKELWASYVDVLEDGLLRAKPSGEGAQ